jgi:hypothetical protein
MARKPGPTRPAPKPQPIAKLDNFVPTHLLSAVAWGAADLTVG